MRALEAEADALLAGEPGIYTEEQLRKHRRREITFTDYGDLAVNEIEASLDDSCDGDEWYEREAILIDMIYRLEEPERRIVQQRIFGHRLQTEIAGRVGLTQGRVSQILKEALIKLRQTARLYGYPSARQLFAACSRHTVRRDLPPVWLHQRAPHESPRYWRTRLGLRFLMFVNIPDYFLERRTPRPRARRRR